MIIVRQVPFASLSRPQWLRIIGHEVQFAGAMAANPQTDKPQMPEITGANPFQPSNRALRQRLHANNEKGMHNGIPDTSCSSGVSAPKCYTAFAALRLFNEPSPAVPPRAVSSNKAAPGNGTGDGAILVEN